MDRRSKEKVIEVEIYTDGSCKKIGNFMTFGGWAFVVTKDNKELYSASGAVENTTNQRMELEAVAQALEYIHLIRRGSERVVIYSDSAYLVNCYLKEWYITWLSKGWLNSQGNRVANRDIWERIIPYFDNFWYDFRHIPGHRDIYWNEYCDQLAQSKAEELKHKWRG